MKIILFQPEIPQNTGNIVRTCSVTGTELILVEPLGFSIADRWLKRAGLDYWEGVNITLISDLKSYLDSLTTPFYFFSSKAKKFHSEIQYSKEDSLIFGSETSGLPDLYFKKWPERFVKIPMIEGSRCLNLATSCGIATYEAWRQQNYLFQK